MQTTWLLTPPRTPAFIMPIPHVPSPVHTDSGDTHLGRQRRKRILHETAFLRRQEALRRSATSCSSEGSPSPAPIFPPARNCDGDLIVKPLPCEASEAHQQRTIRERDADKENRQVRYDSEVEDSDSSPTPKRKRMRYRVKKTGATQAVADENHNHEAIVQPLTWDDVTENYFENHAGDEQYYFKPIVEQQPEELIIAWMGWMDLRVDTIEEDALTEEIEALDLGGGYDLLHQVEQSAQREGIDDSIGPRGGEGVQYPCAMGQLLVGLEAHVEQQPLETSPARRDCVQEFPQAHLEDAAQSTQLASTKRPASGASGRHDGAAARIKKGSGREHTTREAAAKQLGAIGGDSPGTAIQGQPQEPGRSQAGAKETVVAPVTSTACRSILYRACHCIDPLQATRAADWSRDSTSGTCSRCSIPIPEAPEDTRVRRCHACDDEHCSFLHEESPSYITRVGADKGNVLHTSFLPMCGVCCGGATILSRVSDKAVSHAKIVSAATIWNESQRGSHQVSVLILGRQKQNLHNMPDSVEQVSVEQVSSAKKVCGILRRTGKRNIRACSSSQKENVGRDPRKSVF